ncbi:endoplasmic reticulum vesicle transporter-domain-containing protein [Dunaliella salina]|uniref:Endoplasmic reticulum vesicle transporter-domain-containing protein n=1 Tax=Dunaliella salina TaxID=3046 RepID=A0ABQ7FYZ0_DUNSA|nr:endoplasmic reticulum vesicle transporter-domain-containing protein [Dunaliella salina]|eukprot:KAF5827572.1 endoplasmic reticulum vesicle transporter-domain-containing protein [Dunaliella salina]
MSKLKLSQLSAFSRAESHLRQQTAVGGVVTVLGALLALALFWHETSHFWRLHAVTKLSVDLELRHDLPINIDFAFPAIPCAALSIQILDVAGTSQSDTSAAKEMDIHKARLDKSGKPTGEKEYVTPKSESLVDTGAMGEVMNVNIPAAMKHLADVEQEVGRHEGCRLSGTVKVKRVAGRILISTHKLMVFQLFPQLLGEHRVPLVNNMSHSIHHLSFGPAFPGLVNPLDHLQRILKDQLLSFKYFLKVVPTEHHSRRGKVTETHQYSVSEYALPVSVDSMGSAIEFNYDLSPIVVNIDANPPSFLHYLVRISAVVGGAWALVCMVNHHIHALLNIQPSNWVHIDASRMNGAY